MDRGLLQQKYLIKILRYFDIEWVKRNNNEGILECIEIKTKKSAKME